MNLLLRIGVGYLWILKICIAIMCVEILLWLVWIGTTRVVGWIVDRFDFPRARTRRGRRR